MRKLYPHHLIFSPHPQCLPASSLIITLNSLCQTGCWVRMREQMSFQNAAPLSLPLLSNCRKAEEEGGERGKHWYPPWGEEGLVVGIRPSCIIPAPPPPGTSTPAPRESSFFSSLPPHPGEGRSHRKSQNSRTRMSEADQCFPNCSHSRLSYHLYYYLIDTFFDIDSLFFFLLECLL